MKRQNWPITTSLLDLPASIGWPPDSRDPFVTPDRRGLRISYLLGTDCDLQKWDDVWVERGLAYALDAEPMVETRGTCLDSPDGIARACDLRSRGGLERWTLEASLLTGAGDAEIAQLCQLDVEAVKAYSALFFDVRNKLHACDWIVHRALPRKPRRCEAGEDWEFILKHFAYFGGMVMLTTILDCRAHPPRLLMPQSEVSQSALQETAQKLLVRAAILARTLTAAKSASHEGELLHEAIGKIRSCNELLRADFSNELSLPPAAFGDFVPALPHCEVETAAANANSDAA